MGIQTQSDTEWSRETMERNHQEFIRNPIRCGNCKHYTDINSQTGVCDQLRPEGLTVWNYCACGHFDAVGEMT